MTKLLCRLAGALWPALMILPVCADPSRPEEAPPLDEGFYLTEFPVMLAVTRLEQRPDEAAMAVTVIDRRMIEASGARELYELMRLVPGMVVGVKDGSTAAVAYHSLPDEYPRRMQVLIDGRSVYTPAWSGVYWADLPIALDDVERIEVVRGPDSANYGANAFFGVINIVTREALEARGSGARLIAGDNGVREGYVRHGGRLGGLDYRVTVGYSADDGLVERYDSKRTRMVNLRGDYLAGARDEITVQVGVSDGDRGNENPRSSLSVPHDKNHLSYFGQLQWRHAFSQDNGIALRLSHAVNDIDERFFTAPNVLLDPPSFPVDYGMRTRRDDFEFEQRLSPTADLDLVWGLGYRRDRITSPALFDSAAQVENQMRLLFGSFQYRFARRWSLNGGLLVEENDFVATERSPRLGLHYRIDPRQGVRLTVARASRAPSLIEERIDQWIRARTVIPGVELEAHMLLGNEALLSEHIVTQELGYHATFARRAVAVDLKLYRERLDDLVTLRGYPSPGDNVDGEVDRFLNLDDVTIRGFEAEVALNGDGRWLKIAYAYTDIDSTDYGKKIRYEGSAPRHNLTLLGAIEVARELWFSALFSYYDDRMKGWEADEYRDPVRRLDLRLAQRMRLGGARAELAFALRNVLGEYEAMQLLRPEEDYDFINEIGTSAYLSARIELP